MGGYTWNRNSKLNRITAWSNDQVTDTPSEIIYIKDKDTNKKWSVGYNQCMMKMNTMRFMDLVMRNIFILLQK